VPGAGIAPDDRGRIAAEGRVTVARDRRDGSRSELEACHAEARIDLMSKAGAGGGIAPDDRGRTAAEGRVTVARDRRDDSRSESEAEARIDLMSKGGCRGRGSLPMTEAA
jgi:hypothetical protein